MRSDVFFCRQPIPVCLTRKDLKGELERAVNSTYMNQNRGTFTYVYPILFRFRENIPLNTKTGRLKSVR